MPWFEAKDRIRLADSRVVEEGERFQYPYRAGLALVEANRVDWSNPPSQDEPTPKNSGTSNEGTSLESVDWTAVDGIGPSTAEAIEVALDETFPDAETVDSLLDKDLTDLNDVGPSTAADLRSYLEEV